MWQYAVLVLWAGVALTESTITFRDVKIAQGVVRGYLDPEGGLYDFFNIPYAAAPTGPNRFKAPLDPPVWMDTFHAIDRGIVCPQQFSAHSERFLTMQEDCLVANIFVPDTNTTSIPVLVYIHGGGYQIGYGNSDRLNTLVRTNKLIVVTFNYRLGAHGFLCLGTESAPGNAGLKDQVALLRWVQTNIASFGGNPDDVTIFGCSAGSGSVDSLTLSEITSGLFKRAIMDSGVAFGVTGLQIEPLVNAQNYARLLNFDNVDDLEALEEFYKTVSFDTLFSEEIGIEVDSTILFNPCVERDLGVERVFADAPINIIKQGKYNKVPLLYGFAEMEGLLVFNFFDTWKDKMNVRFSDFLPAELYFENEEIKEKVANTVKTAYFGDQPVSEATVVGYINYFTDVLFAYPMLKALSDRIESLNDTIYLYEYSFVDDNSPGIPHTNAKGANHCEQTAAIRDVDKSEATAEYIQIRAIMREYWLNFILTDSPSVAGSELVSWPPANANRGPHMSLGTTVQLKNILLEDRTALWDSIYEEHYRAPVPPGGGAAVSFIISKCVLMCCIMFINILQ